jgi:hypothetical protein
MNSNLKLGILLRAAMLSIAPLALAASTALADPPGSYFPDSWRPVPPQLVAKPTIAAPTVGENTRPASPVAGCS